MSRQRPPISVPHEPANQSTTPVSQPEIELNRPNELDASRDDSAPYLPPLHLVQKHAELLNFPLLQTGIVARIQPE